MRLVTVLGSVKRIFVFKHLKCTGMAGGITLITDEKYFYVCLKYVSNNDVPLPHLTEYGQDKTYVFVVGCLDRRLPR